MLYSVWRLLVASLSTVLGHLPTAKRCLGTPPLCRHLHGAAGRLCFDFGVCMLCPCLSMSTWIWEKQYKPSVYCKYMYINTIYVRLCRTYCLTFYIPSGCKFKTTGTTSQQDPLEWLAWRFSLKEEVKYLCTWTVTTRNKQYWPNCTLLQANQNSNSKAQNIQYIMLLLKKDCSDFRRHGTPIDWVYLHLSSACWGSMGSPRFVARSSLRQPRILNCSRLQKYLYLCHPLP